MGVNPGSATDTCVILASSFPSLGLFPAVQGGWGGLKEFFQL